MPPLSREVEELNLQVHPTSGTEDVYKIYAESYLDANHLGRIQEEAQQIVSTALGATAAVTNELSV